MFRHYFFLREHHIYWLEATNSFGVPSINVKFKVEHSPYWSTFTEIIPITVDNLNKNLASGVGDCWENIEILVEIPLAERRTSRNNIRTMYWCPWWWMSRWFTTIFVDLKVFINISTNHWFVIVLRFGYHFFLGGIEIMLKIVVKGGEIDSI